MNEQTATQTADRQVSLTRVVDAPREAVFRAWTDPDQIASWWGPDGFSAPREKIAVELRVGGRYDVTMVLESPAIASGMGIEVGTEFPDHSEIVELHEPELLVLRHGPRPDIGLPLETATRVELHDEGDGRTRVAITSGPYTEAIESKAEKGWEQQVGKLQRLLAAGVQA